FLRRPDRERRVRRDTARTLANGGLDSLRALEPADQSERQRFRSLDESAGQQHVLHQAWTEHVDQSAIRCAGETVAERPRDGNPKRRFGCGNTEITRERDATAATGCDSFDLG